MAEAWEDEAMIKSSFHRARNKGELWGWLSATRRDFGLSVFRPLDLDANRTSAPIHAIFRRVLAARFQLKNPKKNQTISSSHQHNPSYTTGRTHLCNRASCVSCGGAGLRSLFNSRPHASLVVRPPPPLFPSTRLRSLITLLLLVRSLASSREPVRSAPSIRRRSISCHSGWELIWVTGTMFWSRLKTLVSLVLFFSFLWIFYIFADHLSWLHTIFMNAWPRPFIVSFYIQRMP